MRNSSLASKPVREQKYTIRLTAGERMKMVRSKQSLFLLRMYVMNLIHGTV